MPSLSSLLLASLAITGAYTAAVPPANPGTASLKQVRNTHFRRHGPSALKKAYLKYHATVPQDLENAITAHAKRATGSATTTPVQYDVEYLTPVSIGTPAQVLNLDFDTGSSDLWVFSSDTPKSSVNGQSIYSPAKSSTATKLTGATWRISYGDGSSSSGTVYTDKVTVGGLTAAKQAVESATKVSSQFTADSDNDGLLGLAFSTLNTVSPTRQTTFFDTVKSSLTAPLFTVDLKHNAPGKYNFGFIDTAAYTGAITYTAVDSSQGFWGFTSSGFSVGSGAFTSERVSGIADTGTTLLLLPDDVVKAYYAKVSGARYDSSQGGYTFACSAALPSFTFGIGSSRVAIPGSFINFAPLTDGSTTCFGGIQSNSDIGLSIYGDIALKAAFVVFNGSTKQLGWASKSL